MLLSLESDFYHSHSIVAGGLLERLSRQSPELRRHFNLEQTVEVIPGKELAEAPEAVQEMLQGDNEGMEALGRVYRDPDTGKLYLVDGQ